VIMARARPENDLAFGPLVGNGGSSCYSSDVATRALEEAIEALKRDPTHPVRARVDDLTVELRAVPESQKGKSAADAFREIGPWEGETLEELLTFFAEARRQGGSRPIPDL
jgi:hypothetical protein